MKSHVPPPQTPGKGQLFRRRGDPGYVHQSHHHSRDTLSVLPLDEIHSFRLTAFCCSNRLTIHSFQAYRHNAPGPHQMLSICPRHRCAFNKPIRKPRAQAESHRPHTAAVSTMHTLHSCLTARRRGCPSSRPRHQRREPHHQLPRACRQKHCARERRACDHEGHGY